MSVVRPLPGISFQTQARPLRDVLPRMDIPVFAGFAASGPLHVPVAVEDIAQFAMIFGGDVALPAPRAATEPRFAHLAPSVRAFFRNGGRRCWIVRVGGAEAISNQFRIPNLYEVTPANAIQPAYASARSEGSWSDALRVRTNLVTHALRLRAYDHAAETIEVDVASPREVTAGDLVRLTWLDATVSFHLFVNAVEKTAAGVVRLRGRALWIQRVESSPPGGQPTYVAISTPAAPMTSVTAERLAFDLTVQSENDAPLRMASLGFSPAHARYAGNLPADAALYAEDAPRQIPDLWPDAAQPRFPLAFAGGQTLFVPAGMSAVLSDPASAEAQSATTLERDGLSNYGAHLFLDEHLDDVRVRELLDRADALRYKAGEKLHGIHAALGIEEVTMLAAPDAVHRGWERDAVIASPPASPLQSPLAFSPLPHPEMWRWMDCHAPVPTPLPEVNAGFVACDALEGVPAPLLSASAPNGGTYTIAWDVLPDSSVEVQEATRSDFFDAATLALDGTNNSLTFYGRPAGDYFYRARRIRGSRTSDWSYGVLVRVASVTGWVALEDDGSDVASLASVHVAMVRMCAARADLVALLSLPRDYDERHAIAHTTALQAAIEPEALSYGALWHPWLIGRDEDAGPLRAIPPDGATAGVMAARAIARGAWVAPANEPLRGVVALTPAILPEARQGLQDAAVNLIRQEPAGFVCLDSDTLSTEAEVRALNVRRLLILVRRAAVRAGNDYTFEPNSPSLRNAIKRGFEEMLGGMFVRGAFAGRNAKTSFQVVTDETVNTPRSVDAGRLIADIRIAPSRPLSFLTIRLVQRGETSVAQEVR